MSTDDKYDQHLCCKGFDEPTGMKECLSGIEKPEHHKKSEEIEEGTDRADRQHELAHKAYVPLPGVRQVFLIDIVQRDGDFGKIIQHVVQQYLSRQHRNEGKKKRSASHTEHVAEIRTGAHHYVLHYITEGAASLVHPVKEDPEIVFKEDHLRSVLGNVDGAVNGNTYIGRMKRWGIVDAVPQVAYCMSPLFQGNDYPVFFATG